MRARATLLNLAPAVNEATDTHLLVTLVGEDTDTPRPRLGIVPVIDRSGSMSAQSKLTIVTRALGYLSGSLCDEDHLALVAFDTNVTTPLPATRADQPGLAAFARALGAVRPGGSTNLEGGIRHGLAQAAAMPTDALVRVIVLTDGLANAGDVTRDGLLGLLSDIPEHVSVSFLGVGTDCDHDLLGELANAGRGSYGFIEDAARAGDVLGTEIGGLLETEAHQLVVQVSARRQHARVGNPLGYAASSAATARPATSEAAAADCDVLHAVARVGALLVGQTRHVVVPVRLTGPKRRHARPVTVADVRVTGVIDDTPVELDLLPKVHFGGPVPPLDPDVAAAVELAQVAQAQREAEQAATRGDFTAASAAFHALRVTSGAAAGLSASLAGTYANGQTYNASATMRSSSSHALAGTLAGSGLAFDALAARTIGSYTTSHQRDVAAATSAAALRSSAPVGASAGTDCAVRSGVAAGAPAALDASSSFTYLTPFAPPPASPATHVSEDAGEDDGTAADGTMGLGGRTGVAR